MVQKHKSSQRSPSIAATHINSSRNTEHCSQWTGFDARQGNQCWCPMQGLVKHFFLGPQWILKFDSGRIGSKWMNSFWKTWPLQALWKLTWLYYNCISWVRKSKKRDVSYLACGLYFGCPCSSKPKASCSVYSIMNRSDYTACQLLANIEINCYING